MSKEKSKQILALEAVNQWYCEAPLAELEQVENAIQKNFPYALVKEALIESLGVCQGHLPTIDQDGAYCEACQET